MNIDIPSTVFYNDMHKSFNALMLLILPEGVNDFFVIAKLAPTVLALHSFLFRCDIKTSYTCLFEYLRMAICFVPASYHGRTNWLVRP